MHPVTPVVCWRWATIFTTPRKSATVRTTKECVMVTENARPLVMVYQPGAMKIIPSDARDSLSAWEKKMFEWAGHKVSSSEVFVNGGTCCDSGNDCDKD